MHGKRLRSNGRNSLLSWQIFSERVANSNISLQLAYHFYLYAHILQREDDVYNDISREKLFLLYHTCVIFLQNDNICIVHIAQIEKMLDILTTRW